MPLLISPPSHLRRVGLEQPQPFLEWLPQVMHHELRLDDFEFMEAWALVALAALARTGSEDHVEVFLNAESPAAQFAHAVGFEDTTRNHPTRSGELSRTVKMRRVEPFPNGFLTLERSASDIANLLSGGAEDETVKTIRHVIVELLRNVVQHSHDPLGGVVMAQRMDRDGRPHSIQVAVGDLGIGIQRSLLGKHPSLLDPHTALEKAIQPHISGTFEEGLTGSSHNAGLGLFFISEMTKLTAGKMLLASRGAAIFLKGDEEEPLKHTLEPLAAGVGFPGTLVAFETPLNAVHDYDAMITTINERARQRTPGRLTYRWLRFESAPRDVVNIIVKVASENTAAAQEYAKEQLLPRVVSRQPLSLDFRHFELVTQSFVHALLYEVVRVAWALKCPVYLANVKPAVRSTLEFLESYALAG